MLPFFPFPVGTEDRVSIRLATYSLPELGQLLSTARETVDVAAVISDRGALVGLHDRSVPEALKIVCEGLDLQVSQSRKGHLLLEPNPKIDSRDRHWREALLTNLSRRSEVQTETVIKLANTAGDDLLAKKQELTSHYPLEGNLISQSNDITSGDAPVRAAAIMASNTQSELDEALIDQGVQTDEAVAKLPPELASAVQFKLALSAPLTTPFTVRRSLERDPGQVRLDSVILATITGGGLVGLPNPFRTVTIGNPSIAKDGSRRLFHELVRSFPEYQIAGIGADASAWLESTESATKEELSRAHLSDPVELPIYDPSVSGLVQKWAANLDQEVVMELAPKAESLNFTPYTNLPSRPRLSLADLVLKDDGWCLDRVDSVLVVRNRMAFLDRPIPAPVGAIAQFARLSPGRSGIESNPFQFEDGDPPLPLVDALLPLVRLREVPGDARNWFDWSGYHGLNDGYLFSRAVLLWPGIPGQALTRVQSAPSGKLSIRVADFSEASVAELVESTLSRESLPSERDHAYKQFLGATAEIQWKRQSPQEILIQIILTNITDETLQTGTAAIFRVPMQAR